MAGKGRCETRVLEKNWEENELYEKNSFIFLICQGICAEGSAQVPVGWKEICAVVERSLSIGIQMCFPWLKALP